jgi:3-deoxy-D-manno-octulosonic acid (KDO) 8-phosphate synthase
VITERGIESGYYFIVVDIASLNSMSWFMLTLLKISYAVRLKIQIVSNHKLQQNRKNAV